MAASENVVLKAADRTLPGFEEESAWKAPFFFIQAADTQLGLIENYKKGQGKEGAGYPDEITWDKEIALCTQSVEILNAMRPKPRFFIICGDLVDAFPHEWPDVRKRQEEDFFKVYSKLDKEIPLVCVCGNHDIGNEPTMENIDGYKETFGDDFFSFWVDGCFMIVVNSQFYEHRESVEEYAAEQDKWLDEQLKKAKKAKHCFVFQHIPIFCKKPDEKKFYFNMRMEMREMLLPKLANAGVSKIFCGHYHQNSGGWFEDRLESVVTTAIGCQIGEDTHGMRIVKVKEDNVKHEFHPLDNFPTRIHFD